MTPGIYAEKRWISYLELVKNCSFSQNTAICVWDKIDFDMEKCYDR